MKRIIVVALILLIFAKLSATESAREYFKFAKFSYDERDYSKALNYINKAIELEPDYTNGLILRAEINLKLRNYPAMVPDLSRILKQENLAISIKSDAHGLLGVSYFNTMNLEKALTEFNHSLRLNEANARSQFYMGRLHYEAGRFFQALECFDLAIKYDAGNYECLYYRSKLRLEYFKPMAGTELFDQIMTDTQKSIDLNPEDHRAYKLKCDLMKLNADAARDAYISELTKSIELFPDQADFYAQRGIAKMMEYDFKAALNDINQAIAFAGISEQNLRNRALCYHNLNNLPLAINDYSTAIDLIIARYQKQPDNVTKKLLADTFLMRGRSYERMSNPDDACADFYNAAKLGSKTAFNYYRRNCNVYN